MRIGSREKEAAAKSDRGGTLPLDINPMVTTVLKPLAICEIVFKNAGINIIFTTPFVFAFVHRFAFLLFVT